jgi:hypothetical protein
MQVPNAMVLCKRKYSEKCLELLKLVLMPLKDTP